VAGFPGRVVLGGPLSPVGWRVGFLERPFEEVAAAQLGWLDELANWILRFRVERLGSEPILDQLVRLDPLQTPPKHQLLVANGASWTAHFTNDHLGGDSVSWVGHLSRVLGCHGVLATHVPVGHYSYPATQFELLAPEGEPPLHYVRTVSAGVFDEGRWEFEALGEPQPFEEAGRRLDRDLLLHYLSVLGIEADDPAAYGEGMLVRTRGPWRARTSTIEETQREYGITAET
jgi:hypothetical protein